MVNMGEKENKVSGDLEKGKKTEPPSSSSGYYGEPSRGSSERV